MRDLASGAFLAEQRKHVTLAMLGEYCEAAWNKDPVLGVIGIQSGPPGRRVHSGFPRGHGRLTG